MAECNKQAVEEVKRNIESRKEFLQNEINNMRETISRLDIISTKYADIYAAMHMGLNGAMQSVTPIVRVSM